MSEVEKLYKIAGVKKQYYYFDSADGNTYTWELNENGNDKYNMCFIGKPKIKDREFTPEKQLELIKWLINFDYTHLSKLYCADINFSVVLAATINYLWKCLSKSEQEQIKRILE